MDKTDLVDIDFKCISKCYGESLQYFLDKLTSSSYYISQLKKYGMDNNKYKFEVLSDKHYKQVYELIGSQFTRHGGNFASVIFNINENEKYEFNRYSHVIKHAIKTGLSFVVLDKNNKIISAEIIFDVTNIPKRINYSKLYDIKYIKRGEFTSQPNLYHPFAKSLNNNIKYGLIKKGECIKLDMGAIRDDHKRIKGSLMIFIATVHILIFGYLNTKYVITNGSHIGIIKTLIKLDNYFNNKNNQCKEKPIYTYIFDSKQYFIDKFKNDKWYKDNLNEEYIMNNIDKLKPGFQVLCMDRLREIYNYDVKLFFKHYIKAINKKSKL